MDLNHRPRAYKLVNYVLSVTYMPGLSATSVHGLYLAEVTPGKHHLQIDTRVKMDSSLMTTYRIGYNIIRQVIYAG